MRLALTGPSSRDVPGDAATATGGGPFFPRVPAPTGAAPQGRSPHGRQYPRPARDVASGHLQRRDPDPRRPAEDAAGGAEHEAETGLPGTPADHPAPGRAAGPGLPAARHQGRRQYLRGDGGPRRGRRGDHGGALAGPGAGCRADRRRAEGGALRDGRLRHAYRDAEGDGREQMRRPDGADPEGGERHRRAADRACRERGQPRGAEAAAGERAAVEPRRGIKGGRPGTPGRPGRGYSAAAASSLFSSPATSMALATTPAWARTFCSMLAAIAGLSRRNCLAFSRPWPIRWPSALNQAPDFSTMPAFTPRSISSPSFEMPSPYMMSKSTTRNGGAILFFTTFTRV